MYSVTYEENTVSSSPSQRNTSAQKHKSTSSVYVSPWQRMRAIKDVLRYHKAGSNSDSRRYDTPYLRQPYTCLGSPPLLFFPEGGVGGLGI